MILGSAARPTLAGLLLTISAVTPARVATAESAAPFVTGIDWHERGGTASDPVLNLTLRFDAPAGFSSGEVKLGSVFKEFLGSVALGAQEPGSHAVDIQFTPPGDKVRPWEVIGLTLDGADGQTTTYGFCELASLIETREKGGKPRMSVDCLDGTGWVVYTVRAEGEPDAIIWSRGVATRDNTYAGTAHVMQDAAGAVVTWGTSVSVVYPQAREGTYVRVGDTTVVDEPSPDPAAQPGPHRIVVGVGGSTPDTLIPGAIYRWAAYYAVRPGHFDTPFISLEGTGLTVLDVEVGSSAGIAWGTDFDHSVAIQRSAADASVFADGSLGRTFSRSTTCMFVFLGGRIGGLGSANVARIEGPSAPPAGGVIVAGQPGAYRFDAIAAAGQSWGQHVVAYADMPLMPQMTRL